MLRPRATITFTKTDGSNFQIKVFKGFETQETYEMLTDKCSIIFPRKYQTMEGKDVFGGADPILRRGDRVKIECGYYPNSRTVFEGYIRDVNANIPVEVFCEDEMFRLKKYTFSIPKTVPLITTSKSGQYLKRAKVDTTRIKELKLKELLDIIIPDDIEYQMADNINLGKLRISNMTPAEILERIKREYGLYSKFRDGVLYVGFANDASVTNEETLVMEEMVINSNDLFYKRAEDVRIKVQAISMDENNVRREAESGDEDGEQRTYHYYAMSQADLQKQAEKLVDEEKYTGYHGTIETFLEPYLRHGDRVNLQSKKIPERDGTYLVKSVRRLISTDRGGRQILELGAKVG